MRIKFKRKNPVVLLLFSMIWISICFISCKDEYIYDDKEPDFSGSGFTSIYDFMNDDGNFTYFLRLVDDYGYSEVLSRTGSKTLFPARDDAFERFFQNNPYGVKSYEELTHAQKRNIVNISMVNMAYLSYMLSNVSGSQDNPIGEGLSLRKNSSNTFLDSIPFQKNETFLSVNPWWERFRSNGMWLVENEATSPIVFFTPENMRTRGITVDDFLTFSNGVSYASGDIYANGIKIVERDIICKNGYIHVLEDVMLPPQNMAQIIFSNGKTDLFSHLMDKFSMPYYEESIANQAHTYYDGSMEDRPLIPLSDSIFVKRYFTEGFNTLYVNMGENPLTNYGLLHFDPTDNAYGDERDMGVMFVPTDKALEDYINGERGGYLKDAYGSWDNVPTSLLALFVKNHQKKSFLNSLPHAWPEMNDESSFPMHVLKGDIERSYIASNGIVYVTNTVYPPIDYQCVYASSMTNQSTRIMNWGIQDKNLKFYLYLRSMENQYNLIVPTDEAFKNYRDPVSWARVATGNGSLSDREIWEFEYIPESDMVFANVYNTDASGDKTGTPIRYTSSGTHQDIIRNRLNDILDMHIVVADAIGYLDGGDIQYAETKGGATLKIIDSGGLNTKMTGGGDLEENLAPAEIERSYSSDNGRAYFVDKIMQDPMKSVYTVLSENPEYEHFFNLLNGGWNYAPQDSITPIFSYKQSGSATSGTSGIGYVVNSFNNFRYTVFVPTKEALEKAFEDDPDLWTWEEIDMIDIDREDYAEFKKAKTVYLLEFLKYHFMDNSVYLNGKPVVGSYETAARNDLGKFHRVSLVSNGTNMEITGANPLYKANVIKTEGLYNVPTRDYIVNSRSITLATKIESSSRAVIHLIDNVLKYE